jgi:hypothetical protein
MEVKNEAEKAKGHHLSREGAPCHPYFRKSGSAYQITTALPGIAGRFELSPSFPHSPVVTVVVRATSLPIASLVADSLVGHSVSLSFWKISLPLISKTPGRSRELSAFCMCICGKGVRPGLSRGCAPGRYGSNHRSSRHRPRATAEPCPRRRGGQRCPPNSESPKPRSRRSLDTRQCVCW